MEKDLTEKNLQEIQELELKEEKNKKIIILIAVALIFGGTCYYYNGIANISGQINQKDKISVEKNIKPKAVIPQKPINTPVLTENKTKNTEIKTQETTENKESKTKTKLKPTDKSVLLSLSKKSSGKRDPFSYSESRFIPFASNQNGSNSSYPSNLPPVSGAEGMGNLPALPGFPGSGLATPPAPKQDDLIIVKGFIGNKVIAEIDGVVESVTKNQKIKNVKVLGVHPEILTAEFEMDGKTFTKSIKSLTDDYNGEVQINKNIRY